MQAVFRVRWSIPASGASIPVPQERWPSPQGKVSSRDGSRLDVCAALSFWDPFPRSSSLGCLDSTRSEGDLFLHGV